MTFCEQYLLYLLCDVDRLLSISMRMLRHWVGGGMMVEDMGF